LAIHFLPARKMAAKTPCIYIVDDDPSVQQSLARLMKSAGLAARTFGSAAEFLGSDCPTSPGCLVLDVCLPGMNGPGLQEKLKTSCPAMPVIFITAIHDENVRAGVMAQGALAYFVKPFDGEELLTKVRAALDIGSGE
jgi:FixJ family two-component response regulator